MISRYVLARHEDEFWKKRDQVPLQRAVYDGCAWLDLHYSPFANPEKTEGRNVYSIYYLYCCERAYDLIGNQLIGKHNWFADMAGELVSKQDESGFWNSGTTLKPEDVLDTCFSLLFLRRSTRGAIPYATVTGGSDDPPVDHRDK
jgi:hypothetical protein